MIVTMIVTTVIGAFLLCPSTAWAYIGPGLGLGAIGAILGTIVAVFLAVIGLFWYPIKSYLKKRASKKAASLSATEAEKTD